MPFNLFRKKKPEEEAQAAPQQPEQEQPQPEAAAPAQESEPAAPNEPTTEPAAQEPVQEQLQPAAAEQPVEQPVEEPPQEVTPTPGAPSKTYLKAMPLRELADVEKVKSDVLNGNIIILKVTPLAQKNIEDVKIAVNDLYQFAESVGGDIARLGEERVVICPKTVRIWREKTPKSVSTAA